MLVVMGRNDIQLKKDFYMQKRDAEDRYYQAIQQQKNKKIPYSILLGKNKKKQNLREWKQNNKTFQDEVNKGTTTLNQWRTNWSQANQHPHLPYYQPTNQITHQPAIINVPKHTNFPLSGGNFDQNMSSGYNENPSGFNFLKNFEKKH